ncbi:hypothetical protein ACU4GD_45425 [Cupriavidus basilensis]
MSVDTGRFADIRVAASSPQSDGIQLPAAQDDGGDETERHGDDPRPDRPQRRGGDLALCRCQRAHPTPVPVHT